MKRKDQEYNKCSEWLTDKIKKDGPQKVSDLMWDSGNSDIDRSYVSYIINYDDNFFIDQENNVGLKNNRSDIPNDARPFSSGALKF